VEARADGIPPTASVGGALRHGTAGPRGRRRHRRGTEGVMGLFPQQFIDDLRLQANIVQVVQEYVPLKRAGTTYKGLCPFHSEKTPSFHVNPDKGFFHCFGCGVGGDVFKFLELHEKVGFQDAVKMLAQKFGVSLPEQSAGSVSNDAGLREPLLKMQDRKSTRLNSSH